MSPLTLAIAVVIVFGVIHLAIRILSIINAQTDNCSICGSEIYWYGKQWYCENRNCERHSAPRIK